MTSVTISVQASLSLCRSLLLHLGLSPPRRRTWQSRRWADGTEPSIRLGRRLLVPRAALENLLTAPVTTQAEDPHKRRGGTGG